LIVSTRASYRLACSQPVSQAARHSTSNHADPGVPPLGWDLGPAPTSREFRDPAMCGSLTSAAAAKFCAVHQRHSHFAASLSVATLLRSCQARSALLLTAPPNPVAGMLLAERNWICWRKST